MALASSGYTSGPLVNALLYHVKTLSSIGGVERRGIVRRLDKNAMGLMVVEKTDIAHRGLSEQLKERKEEKLYRALVKGLPERDYYIIEAPIGRHQTDRKMIDLGRRERLPKERFG